MNNFTLKYLGHSAFYIQTQNSGILIDPFISQNPVASFDYTKEKITHIFVTHGHSDHLGDAIIISKNTGAQLVTVFELALYCQQRGANALPVGLGATLNFDFGKARCQQGFRLMFHRQGGIVVVKLRVGNALLRLQPQQF